MPTSNADQNEGLPNSDFDAAFEQASSGLPPQPSAAEPSAAAASEESKEPAVAEEPSAAAEPATSEENKEPPAAAEPTPAEAAAQAEAEAAKPAAQPAPVQQTPAQPPQIDPAFLAAAIAEANRQTQQQPQQEAPKPYQPVTAETFLTEADKAGLNKFKTDWPDEYPALQALIKAEAQAIVANSNHELITQLDSVLAPLQHSTQKAEVNSHVAAIRAVHPDLDSLLDKIPAWIETQPAILRPQFKAISERGSAGEVVEMLNMYKASATPSAAPVTPASSAAQETPPPAKQKTPVSAAAVAATAAVPATQRTAQSKGSDPNDFDAAFEQAAAKTS